MHNVLPYLINTFLLSVALIPICAREAGRLGLVDTSNARKRHVGRIPVVGGIAMFGAVFVTAMMLGELVLQYSAFFAAMSLLVVVGVIDDSKDLSALIKGFAQFVGALIMTLWGGMVIVNLGEIVGSSNLSIPYTGVPFTIFCVVGLINALNMADGADGLAGGIALTALAWLLVAALMGNSTTDAVILSVLIAAVTGFMLYNMRSPWHPRASVFMGDAGSMMLGFALAWFAVDLSQGPQPAVTPVTVLWILALPMTDALVVIIKRLASRRSPFEAGVDHLHHVLQDRGHSVGRTVSVLVAASAVLGGIGMLGLVMHVPQTIMLVLFILMVVLHFSFSSRLIASGQRKRAAAVEDRPGPEVA
jgi:UDP-GlcNAc:undecaprenyl-phosphate GlcNAc-1-phosphate transferase